MQINSASQYSIGALFSSNIFFTIPKYQREYTWGQSQWAALYDDLIENEQGYFIGSIICISKSVDSAKIAPLEVVDGQQRLTTICLLMAALYHEFEKHKKLMTDDQNHLAYEVKIKLRKNDSKDGLTLTPQDQNHNRDDFIYLMREAGILDGLKDASKPNYYGLRNIKRCYDFFINQIQKDVDESDNPIDALFKIKDLVFSAILVKIEVGSHADAYVMFESLNNRGISLTAVDLMKNAALARSEQSGLDPDKCFEKWQKILEYITSDYSTQERFFRFHYNAFRTEINQPFRTVGEPQYPLGDLATKSNLLRIYIKLMDHDLLELLDSIRDSAKIYHQFLSMPDVETRFKQEFKDLNNIKGVSGYIILLYIIRKQDILEIEDSQISRIAEFLTKFFVRRNLTDTPPTRDLNRLFMKFINIIEEKLLKGEKLENELYSYLILNSASDTVFRTKLAGDVYLENADATRYILCKLTESSMTRETWTDLWERKHAGNKMIYMWTIEHIFPEGNNIPQCWVDMIADGNSQKATELRNKYCHKLGNLTITGFNSDLSNMSFIKKRDRVNENNNYIGYKNGLSINKDLESKESWTVEDIERRTDKMVSTCLELFRLMP